MGDTILNRALILKILISAAVIIGGTLFVFWREVSREWCSLTWGHSGSLVQG